MDTIQINKAKEFITEHLKEEFSLNDLASSVGYSAFHLAREFKNSTSLSIMEYTRNERILAASKELCNDFNICDIAMEFCFDTHAGFTRAFTAVFGCTPKEYQAHTHKMKTAERGIIIMENSKIVIRHICESDVQDLWENVYSATRHSNSSVRRKKPKKSESVDKSKRFALKILTREVLGLQLAAL